MPSLGSHLVNHLVSLVSHLVNHLVSQLLVTEDAHSSSLFQPSVSLPIPSTFLFPPFPYPSPHTPPPLLLSSLAASLTIPFTQNHSALFPGAI